MNQDDEDKKQDPAVDQEPEQQGHKLELNAEENDSDIIDETGLNKPEVEKGLSPVASLPGKNMLIIGIACVILLLVLLRYFVFPASKQEAEAPRKLEVPKDVVKPAKPVDFELPTIPVLPDPPDIQAPEPEIVPVAPLPEELPVAENVAPPEPSPKPVPIPPNAVAKNDTFEEPEDDDEIEVSNTAPVKRAPVPKSKKKNPERLASGMFAFGGEQTGPEEENNDSVKHNFQLQNSTAESVRVTYAGDMSSTVAQGKIIDAVLETAVNTDLAGTIRAIVSRDVYSEAGKNVLIPKGSRIIGSYNGERVTYGQKRIGIVWSRIIRPEGIDIQINSNTIDQLGRTGADGIVNNKFFETLANAVLISTVNVIWANVVEDSIGSGGSSTETTTTSTDGSSTTTTTKNETDKAIEDASSNINDTIGKISDNAISGLVPTFTIDQGKKIKIFVNRDLVFPYSISRGTNMLN